MTAAIELAGPADSLQPGREVRIRVNVQYFSGGPAVGTPVTCRFNLRTPRTYYGSEVETDPEVQKWIEGLSEAVNTASTDSSGLAEFALTIPAKLQSGASLSVEATAAPVGGQAVSNRVTWNLNRTGFKLDPGDWRIPLPVRPGETVVFSSKITDGRAQTAMLSGTASLMELAWEEAWLNPEGAIVTGDALAKARLQLVADNFRNRQMDLPQPWRKLHAGYLRRAVATTPVTTTPDGTVQAAFAIPHPGLFQMEISRHGEAIPYQSGWDIDLPVSVVAADDSMTDLPIKPGRYLLGQARHKAGDPVRLLAIVPEGFGPAILTVSGEKDYVAKRVDLQGRVAWIELENPPVFAGEGLATLTSIRSGLPAPRHLFAIDDPKTRVSVLVEPRESISSPGEMTDVRLRATDHTDRTVHAEILLAVSDESVRSLIVDPDESGHQPAFLSYTRRTEIEAKHSLPSIAPRPKMQLRDPRPGALRRPGVVRENEEIVVLSPFAVSRAVSSEGYAAVTTLAGNRLATQFELSPPMMLMGMADSAGFAPKITTRRSFASTAAWMPEIVTDAKGEARVSFKYPDNLTQWHFDAYAVGADGNTFGRTSVLTRTSLPLQARIQAPRFLTEGDKSDIGVLLINRTDDPLKADAAFDVEGNLSIARSQRAPKKGVAVPQQGEARVAWPVTATNVGTAKLSASARAGREGDAMEITLPVLEDGFWQDTAASARLSATAREQSMKLRLPDPFDPARAKVSLKVSPGHIPALLDALPYLVDYPYGCVEQTMSRFMPALVVRKTLVELGLEEEEVESRIVAKESAADRVRREKTAGLLKIDEVAQKSLSRLAEAQSYRGGFGWWPGQDSIDPWMTAYVVWGLSLARECDFDVPDEIEEEASEALLTWIESTDRTDDVVAWTLFASRNSNLEPKRYDQTAKVFKRLMSERAKLGASGRACLTLAAKRWGLAEDRATLLLNLENGATRGDAAGFGQTVHWGSTSGYWRAMDGAVESTALTLLALLELEPKHPLVEPAANWLALNRRSARWSSTRDTAFSVLALSELVARERTLAANATVDILVNGSRRESVKIDRNTLLHDRLGMPIPVSALRAGENEFSLRLSSGDGTVYAIATSTSWSQNEGAHPASHLIGATREFDRKVPVPMISRKVRFTSELVSPHGSVREGEEVVAVVTLTVPNELEYLAIEVPKPAGCEPLNPLSGWDARIRRVEAGQVASKDDGSPIYREEHDNRSVFFLDHIEAGTWEIRFGLRATFSGDYRAAPVTVEAMYVPEIRANTDARRLRIEPATD